MFRVLLLIITLIAVFLLGLFSASTGIFALLTGNVQTNVNIYSVLSSVESLSQLTTTRYAYATRITASRDLPQVLAIAFGEQMTMNAVGYVIAGIDLSELEDGDIRQDGDVLFINLPAPRVQECFFNEQASAIIEDRTALFASYPENLQIAARRLALAHFRKQAIEDGILEEARLQSEIVISDFVQAVAPEVTTVRVVSDPIDVNAPFPETCQ